MMRTTEALDREWRAEHEHSAAGAAAVARRTRAEPALREPMTSAKYSPSLRQNTRLGASGGGESFPARAS